MMPLTKTNTMKRTGFIFIIFLNSIHILKAQEEVSEEFKPSGRPFMKVFWNYNYNFTENVEQRSTFALQRAYFGYKYKFSNNISAKLTIDAARKITDENGEIQSAYTAILKHAQLDWKVTDPLKLSVGLIGLKQFDTQEKFWGYRYIFKSFQDEFKLGSSADLGANAELSLAKSLKANLFVLNGEGYTKLQDEMGRMKAGGNLIWKPIEGLTLKGYYDMYDGKVEAYDSIAKDTTAIHTIAFFAGYETDKFRIGAEYNIQLNGTKYNHFAADHNISGMAVYGTYVINPKFEVFAEWLQFKSNKLEDKETTWNYDTDGNVILGGLQYSPIKGVKMALNYRGFIYDNPDINTESFVFLNFEFAF